MVESIFTLKTKSCQYSNYQNLGVKLSIFWEPENYFGSNIIFGRTIPRLQLKLELLEHLYDHLYEHFDDHFDDHLSEHCYKHLDAHLNEHSDENSDRYYPVQLEQNLVKAGLALIS